MNFEESIIVDSNGQEYEAGWDEHGFFSIIPIERYTVEGEEHTDVLADVPVNLTPQATEKVAELMND
jgi:hypothetical protein